MQRSDGLMGNQQNPARLHTSNNEESMMSDDERPSTPTTPDFDTSNEDTTKKTVPVVFRFEGSRYKEVFVAGSFTNWKEKIPMVRADNDFLAIIELPEGEYQYKFVADGHWECSPNDPTVSDGFNGKNNVLTVKHSDFDVMSALREDSQVNMREHGSQEGNSDSSSPSGSYVNEIPPRAYTNVLDRPPLLPPHLLNIILNRNTSRHCEPALLPEPNHVMLKHLYALSIRDGVIVLSTTRRFRQKYVTTCFYKPI